MKITSIVATAALGLALTACGAKDEGKENADQPAQNSDPAVISQLPEMLVTKVPVVDGQEDDTLAETVELSTAMDIVADAAAESAFAAGAKVAVTDELDLDSSSSQFNRRRVYRRAYNRSSNFYRNYCPNIYSGGYSYNYSYRSSYSYNNYNYYVYNRPSYGNYGFGGGFGGGYGYGF